MKSAQRIVILLLSLATPAWAAPFLIADVDANTDTCYYTGPGATSPTTSAVVVDNVRGVAANNFRVCKIDLSGVPTGTDNIVLAGGSSLWGVVSANVPFSFVRPAAPAVPSGTRLLP